ncbi:MAG: hypothetical protein NTY08_11165 [Proteobacteria bacterium]|nr:hypothetical protein [Pseudomonadota bacterium]
MLSRRQVNENHLKKAQESLQVRVALLTERKLDKKQTKRDVTFRKLEAIVRKYATRLKAMDKADAVVAAVVQRRAEKAAAPKVPKVKKKREVPAVKAKGGGSGKKEKKA